MVIYGTTAQPCWKG